MSPTAPPLGRRERNKQEKLERITRAASDLFSRHGVDEVTTQQIAEAADVGAGTLFLYARTKGELLLLVQNANYARSLDRGVRDAAGLADLVDAVIALITPIVECNRAQVENGRTYLREMVFGDPAEPHHAEALSIVARTEQALVEVISSRAEVDDDAAARLAHVVSSLQFVAMASVADESVSVAEIVADVRAHLELVLPR
ncbi:MULTISPECIES: TetR/AcrR family transcriptional regulator [unclassified Frigoribacterium]|uniref:TetR/AcrR family transcriptional regulator n=1 Tax=unclassified Frigoribacterium TaxID=2627005 RepID=UPI0006FD2DDB|nr:MULTISPECIES: TetR/AcrR family transcriptional regulator [unclassified Frigoribacterium]KQO48100.1 TetR family transcriptional regulator [Frigoribacterium sp. Leaf254]KQT40194.1 TetR family transcriptional regulator [Frigoribacterium sp. Leaf415]